MSDLPPSSPPVMPGPPQYPEYPGGVTVMPTTSEIWEPPKPPAKPRRAVPIFDRVKILVILGAVFVFLLWRLRSDQPAYTFGDALITQLQRSGWILVLALIEVLRQLHYLVSEQNAKYNHFWVETVWGGLDRWKDRRDPWLRYRTARYTKFLAAYLIFSAILANRRGVSFIDGVAAVPGVIFHFLTVGPQQVPFWVSLVFPLLFIVGQFGFLFFFLSRGGVDVYMPEDITTTFEDVWGQDHVLEKVKENVLFLENPRLIEEKGGHVPGGILLWGPPGTGKTLMAEAVAGQTGKPYVFVDPGAFINMFMGVGILKVKSLFRKLRKLSLRYGGVIVFFDEADSLGNRGALAAGGGGGAFDGPDEMREHMRWLSPNSQGLLFDQQRKHHASRAPEEPRRLINKVIVGGMGGGGGTLQSLLSEISGLKKPRGFLNRYVRRFLGLRPKPPLKYRILVMMATNLPEALDEAMLRPGRIDRLYKVGYPSKDGRRRTYEGYLRKVRHQLTPEQIEKLAVITPYATGATIKDMVNEALINALRNGRDAVTWEDIIWAKHFKALGPSEDVEYVERDRHSVAIHEACHAVVAYRVRHHWTIDLATIEKGGNYLGDGVFGEARRPVQDLEERVRSRPPGVVGFPGRRAPLLRRRQRLRRGRRPSAGHGPGRVDGGRLGHGPDHRLPRRVPRAGPRRRGWRAQARPRRDHRPGRGPAGPAGRADRRQPGSHLRGGPPVAHRELVRGALGRSRPGDPQDAGRRRRGRRHRRHPGSPGRRPHLQDPADAGADGGVPRAGAHRPSSARQGPGDPASGPPLPPAGHGHRAGGGGDVVVARDAGRPVPDGRSPARVGRPVGSVGDDGSAPDLRRTAGPDASRTDASGPGAAGAGADAAGPGDSAADGGSAGDAISVPVSPASDDAASGGVAADGRSAPGGPAGH